MSVQKAKWMIMDVLRTLPRASTATLVSVLKDNGMSNDDYYQAIIQLDSEGKVDHDGLYFTRRN